MNHFYFKIHYIKEEKRYIKEEKSTAAFEFISKICIVSMFWKETQFDSTKDLATPWLGWIHHYDRNNLQGV